MKNKLTALLLSAVLCLSLVGNAFAAGVELKPVTDGTVTITADVGKNEATVKVDGLTSGDQFYAWTLSVQHEGNWGVVTTVNPKVAATRTYWKNIFENLPTLAAGDIVRLNMPDRGLYFEQKVGDTVTITFSVGAGATLTPADNAEVVITKGGALSEKLTAMPTAEKTGFTATTWAKTENAAESDVTLDTQFDADTTLYPVWKATTTHTHTYGAWQYNEREHWRTCTANDGAEERGVHQFEGNECSVCHYKKNGGSTFIPGVSGGGSSSTTQRITVKKTTGGTVTCRPGSPSKGTTVTVLVHPNAGYVLDELRVYDRNGKLIDVTKVSDTEYTFVMPEGAVTVEPIFKSINAPATGTFSDVPSSHTFYSDISWVASKGYMGGYGDGTFRPSANTTRQALWMVLARIDGANPADMTAARSWAVRNNISDGTNPGGAMSRQQMVTMLYRYAQMKGYATTGGTSLDGFKDAAAVADYAKDAMSWAVGNGIVQGNNNSLLPTGTATRAHFAAFLHRFCTTVGIA